MPVRDSSSAEHTAADTAAAASGGGGPPPFREIRAVFSEGTIRVYQAYSDRIADAAVAANSFRAPLEAGFWSAERMTWIKPSAVWMAYRCGWTTKKDKNQARVLALDLCAHRFRQVMLGATVVHGNTAKGEMKRHEVIVQWDPERVIDPSAEPKQVLTRKLTHVRSIQVGLRGGAVQMLLDPAFVRRISDATPRFREAVAALEAGGGDAIQRAEAALWKGGRELPWHVDAGLRWALCMDAALLLQDPGAMGGVKQECERVSLPCRELSVQELGRMDVSDFLFGSAAYMCDAGVVLAKLAAARLLSDVVPSTTCPEQLQPLFGREMERCLLVGEIYMGPHPRTGSVAIWKSPPAISLLFLLRRFTECGWCLAAHAGWH
jgi:hypothetical protein